MNLFADESVNAALVRRLRQEGHDVLYAHESSPGAPDNQILDSANREHRVLITFDKDFGELVFRQGLITTGVLLVRLSRQFDVRSGNTRARTAKCFYGYFSSHVPGSPASLMALEAAELRNAF